MKDLRSHNVIYRSNSSGDLYPALPQSAPSQLPAPHGLLHPPTSPFSLWHRRLGHPGDHVFKILVDKFISFSRSSHESICNACELGKNSRLPFSRSLSQSTFPFQLVFADLWTSHVLSFSGCKYYLLILDDFSNYIWTLPLRHKSDVYETLVHFSSFIKNHFNCTI